MSLNPFIRIMRPNHWVKNGFVLVPAFFGGQLRNPSDWVLPGLAFILFCVISSCVYIFNDLYDLEADKKHATKRLRPLPKGTLSQKSAVFLLVVLTICSLGLGFLMHPPIMFVAIILLYVAINITYSLGLKHIAVLELFLLASGYMFRLVAGAEIATEHLTGWIIVSTALIALLMAAGKRHGDLAQAHDKDKLRKSLHGYTLAYLDQIIAMLAAATIVTYLLFCISDYAIARFGTHIMWSAVFVLYGILRYMQILTVEGGGAEPTALIYRDKPMLLTILLFTLFFTLSIYLH